MIVVTVFEGEPYDLWNLRNLARHVRLVVARSFRFEAAVYEGYKHVRTLGNLDGGGGWSGEERMARTFCLEIPGEIVTESTSKKRGGRDEDEDSDDDDD